MKTKGEINERQNGAGGEIRSRKSASVSSTNSVSSASKAIKPAPLVLWRSPIKTIFYFLCESVTLVKEGLYK